MFAEPVPRGAFLLRRNSVHDEALRIAQRVDSIEKGQRGSMVVLAAQERPRLADDEIGSEDLLGTSDASQHCQRLVVSSVPRQCPCHPPTGVGELHWP
jgi:hypothetical protein